jgi:hypothetical protein
MDLMWAYGKGPTPSGEASWRYNCLRILVETKGIEPSTSALRTRRSPS